MYIKSLDFNCNKNNCVIFTKKKKKKKDKKSNFDNVAGRKN